jgi:hypothetical protein
MSVAILPVDALNPAFVTRENAPPSGAMKRPREPNSMIDDKLLQVPLLHVGEEFELGAAMAR